MKNKEQLIFEKCLQADMPVHNFRNNTRCIFYKGFKFEEDTKDDGSIEYYCYNTRSIKYKELTDEEMDMIMEYGVILSSNLLSFKSYRKNIEKYSLVLSNGKVAQKSIDTANKAVINYQRMCDNILNIHKKHKELFV